MNDLTRKLSDGASTKLSHDILKFEEVLLAADKLAQSQFETRRQLKRKRKPVKFGKEPSQPRVKLGFGDSSDESDESDAENGAEDAEDAGSSPRQLTKKKLEKILNAFVKTIAVVTNSEAPDRIKSQADAMRWTSKCILDARYKTILDTRKEKMTHALTPDQTMEAFTLMNKLNNILSH